MIPTSDATQWPPTWQSTKGAPKDGSRFLALCADRPPFGAIEQRVDLARWIATRFQSNSGSIVTGWMPPTETLAYARIFLAALTDEQRMELFGAYCKSCGSDDPGCQCWNDE